MGVIVSLAPRLLKYFDHEVEQSSRGTCHRPRERLDHLWREKIKLAFSFELLALVLN